MEIIKVLLLLAAFGESKDLEITKQNLTQLEDPIKNVHLIRSIGVCLIESDDQLVNGQTDLKLAVQFSSNFFNGISKNHQCNDTSDETKAIIKTGQELYSQLLSQLQHTMSGTKAAKVERKRDIQLLAPQNYFFDYESYEYEQLEVTRLLNFLIAEVENESTIIKQKGNIVEPLKTNNKIILQYTTLNFMIIPTGYVSYIKWSEKDETKLSTNQQKWHKRNIEIMGLKFSCEETCDVAELKLNITQEKVDQWINYKISIEDINVVLQVTARNENITMIMKSFELYGVQADQQLINIKNGTDTIEVISVKAPLMIQENNTEQYYVLFDTKNHNVICKHSEVKTMESCSHVMDYNIINVGDDQNNSVRNRRGILELIKTGNYFASDFTKNMIHEEVDVEKQRDNLLSKNIKTLSDVTNHIIYTDNEQFDSFEETLCLLKEDEDLIRTQSIISQKISSLFYKMTRVVEHCSFGKISLEINLNHLRTLCALYVLDEQKCSKLHPVNIRELFLCEGAKLQTNEKGVTIHLTVSIPNILHDNKAMKIETIPIFVNNEKGTKIRTLLIKNKKVFETPSGYLSFDSCPKLGGVVICDEKEAKNDDSLNCLRSLINNDSMSANKFCIIHTEFSKSKKCFSKSTTAGELISTQEPVYHQTKLFAEPQTGTGVSFIKTSDLHKSFVCGKQVMLQSNQHEIQEIQIIDHEVQLNLSRLLDAEKMPYVEKETTILHKKIAHNAMALSQLMHKTENKMMITDQELEKLNIPISKNKTIHIAIIIKILMFITTMTITFLIMICIYKKCCDCLI